MSKLYLVPTPIGNLEDITLRALRILKEVDVVAAEDTRNSGQLLRHFGIEKQIISHHAHNEHAGVAGILKLLKEGKSVAYVSDAGTPGLSDPGFLLVNHILEAGLEVECLPGATAMVPALVNSGLPMDRFVFEGFLPAKKGRQTKLALLAEEERTMVLYESCHRIVKTLEQLKEVLGAERQVCVSRELTKLFEENNRGTLDEILAYYQAKKEVKGEIVLIVAGGEKKKKKSKYEVED